MKLLLGFIDFFCLLAFPISIIWFFVLLIMKKNIKKPVVVFLSSLVIFIVSMFIYSQNYYQADTAKKESAESKKAEVAKITDDELPSHESVINQEKEEREDFLKSNKNKEVEQAETTTSKTDDEKEKNTKTPITQSETEITEIEKMEKSILSDELCFNYDEENYIKISYYLNENSLKPKINVNIKFSSKFEKECLEFWNVSCSMLYNVSDEVFITTNLGKEYFFTLFTNGEIERNTLIAKFSESETENMTEYKTQLKNFLIKNNFTILEGYKEKNISQIINADYEKNLIDFKDGCREFEYDDLFFGDYDIEGRKVKINLMVLSLAQDNTDPYSPVKCLRCGAERKTDSGISTYVGGELYLYDNRSNPNITEFKEGDKLTVYGEIVNYNYNTWDGYNNFGIKAKIIEKTK